MKLEALNEVEMKMLCIIKIANPVQLPQVNNHIKLNKRSQDGRLSHN